MAYEYNYRIIKEHHATGERGKRSKIITRYKPLTVGGLYFHLGKGCPGSWRVLELVSKTEIKD